MIVPSTVHRLPCPRYVQVVEPDPETGKLPPLLCPHNHYVKHRVDCWGEYGFVCEGDTRRRLRHERRGEGCGARLWLISLPGNVYMLIEVTLREVETMRAERMQRWQQLAYLWRAERERAA